MSPINFKSALELKLPGKKCIVFKSEVRLNQKPA